MQIGFIISKSLDTLPQDIYNLLEGKSIYDSSVLERFAPDLLEVLKQSLSREDKTPTLRMSIVGKPYRMLWYELNNYTPEAIEGKTLFKFLYGHLIEALVLCLAEASGHDVQRRQEEVSVDGIVGHIDAVIDGVLVDVKSASPYGYKKFEDGTLFGEDTFGYVGQISGYAVATNLPAAFIAINKVLGDICTLKVPQEIINAYDVTGRIKKLREAISSPDAPDRCYGDESDGESGNRKLGVGCSYCSYKSHCWKDSNDGIGLRMFAYGNGLRYLTAVKRQPKIFEITKKV